MPEEIIYLSSDFIELKPTSWGRQGSNDRSVERTQVDAIFNRDGIQVEGIWGDQWQEVCPGIETRLIDGLRATRIYRTACPLSIRFHQSYEYQCYDNQEACSEGSSYYWIRYENEKEGFNKKSGKAILRILVVEDTQERQDTLENLVKDHAWIMVNTASRAIRMVQSYRFDLIFLDYDLAGEDRGDRVAAAIRKSNNVKTKVIVHSMNAPGASRISRILPQADVVPLSKITKNNATFKRLRQELQHGTAIDWKFVFAGAPKEAIATQPKPKD
jgi:CheY-like chemotaxis protein